MLLAVTAGNFLLTSPSICDLAWCFDVSFTCDRVPVEEDKNLQTNCKQTES